MRLRFLILLLLLPIVLFGQVKTSINPTIETTVYAVTSPLIGGITAPPSLPASYFASGIVFPNDDDSLTIDSIYTDTDSLFFATEGMKFKVIKTNSFGGSFWSADIKLIDRFFLMFRWVIILIIPVIYLRKYRFKRLGR